MSPRCPKVWTTTPLLDYVSWTGRCFGWDVGFAAALELEEFVPTSHPGRLLAALTSRALDSPATCKFAVLRQGAQQSPSLRAPFKCHVLRTINAFPLGGEMSVGSGEHQHVG